MSLTEGKNNVWETGKGCYQNPKYFSIENNSEYKNMWRQKKIEMKVKANSLTQGAIDNI